MCNDTQGDKKQTKLRSLGFIPPTVIVFVHGLSEKYTRQDMEEGAFQCSNPTTIFCVGHNIFEIVIRIYYEVR